MNNTAEELTPQQIASSSLLSYVGLQYPKYIAEPAHELMATALEAVEAGNIRRLLINIPPQHGKPVYEEEQVLMGDGSYKKLKNIMVGDYVITHKGRPKKVLKVFKQGELPTIQLNTQLGRNPCAAKDHPFLTPSGWIEAGKLEIKDTLAILQKAKTIPTTEKSISEFVVAGYLLGDGCTAPNGNTCAAEMTIDDSSKIGDDFTEHSNLLNFTINKKYYTSRTPKYNMSTGIDKDGNKHKPRKWIMANDLMGKSHDKHIPKWVFTASNEKITAMIGSYFACDGHVGKRDKIRSDCYCEFYSVSYQLLYDIQNLLLRIGVASKIAVKNGICFGKPHKSWRLTINNVNDLITFRDKIRIKGVKAKLFMEWPLHRNQFQSKYIADQIISIENTGMRKCRCLLVEDDHTFTIQNIVVHNTLLASTFFPAWVLGRHPDWSIIASTFNQTRANEVGGAVRNILTNRVQQTVFPNCQISQDTKSSHHVSTNNMGHYYSAGIGGTITGRSAKIFLVDDPLKDREDAESKLVREKIKEWYRAVAYTRLRPDNRIIIIQTRWHCFHPESLILTTNGWVNADNIKRDALFITQKGIEPITKMESREYIGDMYEITLYGQPKPIKVTGNHGILTTNGWKYAEQITKNDWCIVPQIGEGNIPKFEEPKTSKASCNANLTGVQNHVPKEKLKKLLDEGKTYTQCAKHFGLAGRGSINGYVTLYNLNRNTNTVAPQQLREDPNFWRVVGYWLAEGNLSKSRKHYDEDHYTIIILSIGSHEQWIADDIKNVMEKYKINVTFSPHKIGKAIKVQFSCWQIAQYLKTHFGYHAYGKQLPEWIGSLPQEMKQELLIGYFRGDGCFSNKIGYRGASVSLKLLTDMQRLFASMGVPSGIVKGKKAGKYTFSIAGEKTYESNCRESYELRVHESYIPWMDIKREKYPKRENHPQYTIGKRINGTQLELKVKKISKTYYNGPIYDFETPSHTITSAGVIVHNSDDLSGFVLNEHAHENWTILELRAIAEKDDILGRPIDAALCPNMYDEKYLANVKLIEGTYNWESLYQQRPIAREGGIIQYEWINDNCYEKLPEDEDIVKTIISWDTSYRKGDLNDPTAGTVWNITKNGYYLIDVLNKKLEFHKIIEKIKTFHEKYHPSAHLIEGRASGQPIIDELKRTTALPIIEVSTKNLDKEVRLSATSGLFESGKVHFPDKAPWLIEAKDQVCLLPSYKYDDIADSISHFLNWVNKPRYVRRPPSKLYWK